MKKIGGKRRTGETESVKEKEADVREEEETETERRTTVASQRTNTRTGR